MDGQWKLNPSFVEREAGGMDLVVAGTPDKVIMVEAGCHELPEAEMLSAMQFGAKEMEPVLDFIKKIQKEIGVVKVNPMDNPDDTEIKLKRNRKRSGRFYCQPCE